MATIKEKCKVCGAPMESAICHQCGWTPVLFPARVPKAISDFENERINVAKETIEKKDELEAQKKRFQEQNGVLDRVSSELSKTHDELKKKEDALKSAELKIQSDGKEIKRLNGELEEERKRCYTVGSEQSKQLSQLQSQLSSAIHEREEVKRLLNNEQDAHNMTKQQVKQLNEEIERLSSRSPQYQQLTETKRPSQPNSPKAVIGKAVFTSGSRTETVELYEGLCRVTAPQWTNINGVLFEIDGDKGVYRLRDLNGGMCNRNARPVSYQGVTTFNNDVFTIGSLTIRLSLPEIDYESLY